MKHTYRAPKSEIILLQHREHMLSLSTSLDDAETMDCAEFESSSHEWNSGIWSTEEDE